MNRLQERRLELGLTGDGNAVVPEQFYPVLAFIAAYERGEIT